MAIQNRATWARLKVGILSIFAMTILAVLIFLITGNTNIFESNVTIYTFMADAGALTTGAPVNLDGIPIGKVKTIALSGSKDPMRLVRLDMELPEHTLKDIPSDSLASISSANVLGTKYINIKSGKSTRAVGPDQEIPSVNTGELQDLVQQGFGVMNSLQDTVQRVDKNVGLVEDGKGSIGKLLVDETLYNNLLQILAQVKGLADTLNSDKGTLGILLNNHDLYDRFTATLGRVDTMLQQLQNGEGTAGKLLKDPALYNETQQTIADVHKLVDNLNAGQGTIGQLLVNQQLFDNLNGATREMHLLMQDFRANPKKFLRIKLSIF